MGSDDREQLGGQSVRCTERSPVSPRLIGHRGDTLRATEFLVGQMVKRHDPLAPRVLVDVAGYKRSRREALEQMAAEVATLGGVAIPFARASVTVPAALHAMLHRQKFSR